MKNLKKIVAGLIAISMMYTLGVSTLASAEETQKTFYTGDVNLDGKVNTLDLLSLKKMLLGLADLQEMYIDGDTLKLVEDTQGEDVTIKATEYTVDVENSTIHVTQKDLEEVLLDITLKVTDNTTFSGEFSNLEELSKKLEENTHTFIAITYDSLTNEISQIAHIEILPPNEVVTIQTYEYTVDVENSTIHVTGIGDTTQMHDLTLKVTNNTTFSNEDINNLEELSKYSEAILDITYNDKTMEVIKVENIVMPPTTDNDTIDTTKSTFMMGTSEYNYMGYVVDLEENLIKVQVDTVPGSSTPVYLLLKVTDDTIFNGQAKTLEELKNLNYPYYVFTFNRNQELVSIEQLEIAYQIPLVITKDVGFYFNTSGNASDIILNDDSSTNVQVTEDTVITLDGVTTTLENIAKAQVDSTISISYQYDVASQKNIALNITGESTTKDIKSIYLYYAGSKGIFGMNTEERTISIVDYYYNEAQLYYINDDTQYSGLVSSIDDLSQYKDFYVNNINIQYDWNINYYTNAEGKNIIISIDVIPVEMVE